MITFKSSPRGARTACYYIVSAILLRLGADLATTVRLLPPGPPGRFGNTAPTFQEVYYSLSSLALLITALVFLGFALYRTFDNRNWE